ncbi:DNA-directed RNA polymerase III subunit RPC5 [Thoreauomyces humboldtii]|nr:DNA-directed RNA polymerase III subunit RPC5 [Thoreauomyces humboldtii]
MSGYDHDDRDSVFSDEYPEDHLDLEDMGEDLDGGDFEDEEEMEVAGTAVDGQVPDTGDADEEVVDMDVDLPARPSPIPLPMEDEDGEIERRIDVYFSQSLTHALHLWQFPTRAQPFDEQTKPTIGRMKTRTKRFELEVPLQTVGSHYNRTVGEEMGRGTDDAPLRGRFDFEDNTPTKLLDKQKYSSSLLPTHSNFMAGRIITRHNGTEEVHLTPLKTALQMRTSLYYIDKIDEKSVKRREEDNMDERKKDTGVEEEGKVLSVTVKGPEDNDAKRRAAQLELQLQAEAEPWQPMSIYHPSSDESRRMLDSLECMSLDEVRWKSTADKYLDAINPALVTATTETGHSKAKKDKEHVVDPNARAPLADRVRALLINANIADFSTIVEVLQAEDLDDSELLSTLSASAVLVRGAWVVRSELMYSGHALHARRWLLYMFQQQEFVSRSEFAQHVRIPGPMATGMLLEIAVLEPGQGWSLKVAPEVFFIRDFGDVVSEQAAIVQSEAFEARTAWEAKAPEIVTARTRKVDATAKRKLGAAVGKKAKNDLTSSIQMKGKSTTDQFNNFVNDLLLMFNVLSTDFVTQAVLVRSQETDLPDNKLLDLPEEEVVEYLDRGFLEIRTNLWVRKDTKSVQLDAVRPTIIEIFKHKEVTTKKEVMDAVKAAGKELSPTQYTKIMQEFSNSKGGGKWHLKESQAWVP